jgi:hypothetical protein
MKIGRFLMVALTGSLLLTAAACSRGAKQNPEANTSAPVRTATRARAADSCALISKAEVAQVVGAGVGDSRLSGGECIFIVDQAGSAGFMVQNGMTPEAVMEAFKQQNMQVSETRSTIGDRSFFIGDNAPGGKQLCAFKGRRCILLSLTIPGVTDGTLKTFAQELMCKAIARL